MVLPAISLAMEFLRRTPPLIAAAFAVVVTLAACVVFDRLIDDPAERAAARRGWVQEYRLKASEARAAELARQTRAAQTALIAHRTRLASMEAERVLVAARTEQEIADYERKLADTGRSCRLSRHDVDWLRKP